MPPEDSIALKVVMYQKDFSVSWDFTPRPIPVLGMSFLCNTLHDQANQ
jgi:hypothetical protein